MPVIFLKSGGTLTCTGYTVRDGVVKAVDVQFDGTDLPEDKQRQAEAAVALGNVLYIIPGRL
ncbi:hypothetical protein JXB37_08660 [candidate division WOR-3 bacterium]|nr:hypothetical protein [candidate division WOR-3 bacterium]